MSESVVFFTVKPQLLRRSITLSAALFDKFGQQPRQSAKNGRAPSLEIQ